MHSSNNICYTMGWNKQWTNFNFPFEHSNWNGTAQNKPTIRHARKRNTIETQGTSYISSGKMPIFISSQYRRSKNFNHPPASKTLSLHFIILFIGSWCWRRSNSWTKSEKCCTWYGDSTTQSAYSIRRTIQIVFAANLKTMWQIQIDCAWRQPSQASRLFHLQIKIQSRV